MSSFYDTNGFSESLDVSANTRKFQTSVIVKQDPNKSGILSFLESVEETISSPGSAIDPGPEPGQATITPSQSQGGYP